MEKKEYLKEYGNIKKQIQRIELHIEEIRTSKMYPSAIKYSDMPKGTDISDLSDYAVTIDKDLCKLMELQAKKKAKLDEIMDAIYIMDDEVEKDVLVYRYIRGFSWETISEIIGYSIQSVYRYHGKALQHFEIPKEKVESK